MDIAQKYRGLARLAAAEIALAIKHREAGKDAKADEALRRASQLMQAAMDLEAAAAPCDGPTH